MGVPDATLADPQTLNLYAYMRNNPLSGIDADGHLAADGGLSDYDAETGQQTPSATKDTVQSSDNRTPSGQNRQPDGSYKATPAQLTEIQEAADKKTTIGDGQCVTACKRFTGVPNPTSSWEGGNLQPSSPTRTKVPRLPLS